MSSDGYANRLSFFPNKGVCGLPERIDTSRTLTNKLVKLVAMVKNADYVVVLTGAGVSTSAGIPDFRGPNGIWTLEEKKRKNNPPIQTKKRSKIGTACNSNHDSTMKPHRINNNNHKGGGGTEGSLPIVTDNSSTSVTYQESKSDNEPSSLHTHISFEQARPTYTHRALTTLAKHSILKYCITQNVDGLHMRSGLPRSHHCFLHGCIFTERCESCLAEYFRDYDIGGLSFRRTGRTCDRCRGDLRDTILDWEDELPEQDWARAQSECDKSDLVLCLGTSLRIEPVGSLPTLATRFVIVNMQATPYDDIATLILRAKVDDVMMFLMESLGLEADVNGGNDTIE